MRETESEPDAPHGAEEHPARIGRYEIKRVLAADELRAVYEARDPQLGRRVALKVISPEAGTSRTAARLLREARASARIRHPNVVNVFDVGEHEGHVFAAMEFLEGETLSEWLAKGQTWTDTVQVMLQAADGLHAAHAAKLVHRNFKPENVIVEASGRVRVRDFGLARSAFAADVRDSIAKDIHRSLQTNAQPLGGTELTMPGEMVGTPAYMAPEQYMDADVDARSDQFAFAAVLFEALYGRRAFESDNFMTLALAVVQGDIAPTPESRVPLAVDKIVRKGLSSDPNDRFDSLDALRNTLAATVHHYAKAPKPADRGAVVADVVDAALDVRFGSLVSFKYLATGPSELVRSWIAGEGRYIAPIKLFFMLSTASLLIGGWIAPELYFDRDAFFPPGSELRAGVEQALQERDVGWDRIEERFPDYLQKATLVVSLAHAAALIPLFRLFDRDRRWFVHFAVVFYYGSSALLASMALLPLARLADPVWASGAAWLVGLAIYAAGIRTWYPARRLKTAGRVAALFAYSSLVTVVFVSVSVLVAWKLLFLFL